MTDKQAGTVDPSFEVFVEAVLGRKAMQVVLLDVRKLTSFADMFIICSGRSHRQVTAIAEFVHRYLKQQGKKPLSVEGKKEGHWVLMDYGEVIIHIFYEPLRGFYDLESLWIDAKRLRVNSLLKTTQNGNEGQGHA